MEGLGDNVVAVLQYLTPGFLSAWIFYSLTSQQPSHQFERIIQALIFTFFITGFLSLMGYVSRELSGSFYLEEILERNSVGFSFITSILFGLLAAYVTNTDQPYIFLRRMGFTRQSAYVSTWSRVFSINVVYVVLHLQDGKRIFGWPHQWPSDWNNGHFALKQASWLSGEKSRELADVEILLIDVKDVRWVEFMKPPAGGTTTDAQQNSRPPASAS